MSFFNKLFGGDDKKKGQKEQPTKAAPKPEEDKAIKLEAAVNNLDQKI